MSKKCQKSCSVGNGSELRAVKFSIHLSVRKSGENYRQIYRKSKASLWRNLSTGMPLNFFRIILCFVALVYNWYFFSEQPFYGNYSTLDSHTNTVISHTFAYSSRWLRKPWHGLLAPGKISERNMEYYYAHNINRWQFLGVLQNAPATKAGGSLKTHFFFPFASVEHARKIAASWKLNWTFLVIIRQKSMP